MHIKMTVNQLVSIPIIVAILFFAFLSPMYRSLGFAGYIASVILIIVNLNFDLLRRIFPLFLFATVVMLLLLLSGRISERGFNAPVSHATHFNTLLLAAVVAEYMKKTDYRARKKIIYIMAVLLCVSIVISLYYVFQIDRFAIRYNEGWGYSNVLHFEQTYGICMNSFSFFLLYISMRKYKCSKREKFCILAFLALFLFCIAMSLFATAVILVLLGMMLVLAVMLYSKNKGRFLVLFLIVSFFLIMIFFFSEQVSSLIYKATEDLNWIVQQRIRGVADVVFSTKLSTVYSMKRRTELAGYSMSSFKSHPLLGIGYSGFGYGKIGMHQEWVDMLGTFGLLGTGCFAVVFLTYAKRLFRRCDNRVDRNAFFVALCMLFVLGFVNPCLNFPVLFAVLCVAPNISCFLSPDEEFIMPEEKRYAGNQTMRETGSHHHSQG